MEGKLLVYENGIIGEDDFMQSHVHNQSPCLFCQYLQTEVKEVTNAHTR
jgi:hypothetical protein